MGEFVGKNRKSIILSFLFSLVCFGFMLTHFTVTIDEESWILSSQDVNMWLYQGRFVIWLFDLLFTDGGNYAPFLWDFAGVFLWNLSGVIFACALLGKTEVKQWQLFIFLSYYSSLPFVLADVFSFSMYGLQIGLAAVAVAAAFYITHMYMETGNKLIAAAVFVLLLYSFGTYQAFICVYISAVAADCLLRFVWNRGDEIRRLIVVSAVICLVAIISYYLINFLIGQMIGTQGYLTDNYMGWTSDNPLKAFAMAVANIGRVSLAIPYHEVYVNGAVSTRVITVGFVLYAIWKFFKVKGAKEKLGIFVFTVLLCMAPFSLYLVIATFQTHGRMMLALPLVGAVQLYLIFQEIEKRSFRYIMLIVAGYLLFINARDMNLFFYYSSISYEKDCTTADQLMYDIQKEGINYKEKPIVFVGMIEQTKDPKKELGVLGGSMFAWDEGNNTRMIDFIETRGYEMQPVNSEQKKKALEETKSMAVWPQEGSIKELDDLIVVYLSEPTETWYITNNVAK